MNTDTFMCSSDEKQTRSPLSLYSEYQRMEIEFRAPHIMPTSHWHGQVEVNVPFDGDVEYLINNEKVNCCALLVPSVQSTRGLVK